MEPSSQLQPQNESSDDQLEDQRTNNYLLANNIVYDQDADEDQNPYEDDTDEEEELEDDDDIDAAAAMLNDEEQIFLQQQIENEFMNAGDDDDDSEDDGLVLAGDPDMNGMSAFNPMAGTDQNTDLNFQKLGQIKQLNGWIQWFISLQDHDFLLEIDRDYLSDKMNLLKIREHFPTKDRYKECMRLLMSSKVPNEEDLQNQKFLELNQDASDLYCLIHNRYVQSSIGLSKIYNKYLQSAFGTCPRALCDRQKVLPIGLTDKLRSSRVKVYCPCCEECYLPRNQNINLDGFFFGSALPHIFMRHFPQAIILPPKVYLYQPKIYGFKLFGKRGSKYYKPTQGSIKETEYDSDIKTLVDSFKKQYQQQKQQMLKKEEQVKPQQDNNQKAQQSARGKPNKKKKNK